MTEPAVLPTVRRLGEISVEYQKRASEIEGILVKAADAEANYRATHAKRALSAMVTEAASAAKAEIIANADDEVSDACFSYKVQGALAEAAKCKLTQLRAALEFGKAKLYADLGTDKIHAQGMSGAA